MPQWLFAFIAPPATEISWAGRLPTFSRLSLACKRTLKNEMKIVRCQTNIPSLPDTSAEVSIYEGYLLFTRRLE